MAGHQRMALNRFALALGCALAGIFFAVASLWLMSFLSLYCASFCAWSGLKHRKKAIRLKQENEWWARARKGVEQKPLDPCCVTFGNTRKIHQEAKCTRYRYKKPKPITREERLKIDEAWSEIVSRLRDPEYGEEQ